MLTMACCLPLKNNFGLLVYWYIGPRYLVFRIILHHHFDFGKLKMISPFKCIYTLCSVNKFEGGHYYDQVPREFQADEPESHAMRSRFKPRFFKENGQYGFEGCQREKHLVDA